VIELPWLFSHYAVLRQARAADRFPHALLLHAAEGAGGEPLALFAAQLALCREAAPPCGRCRDCRQVELRQHPDLYWVAPEESKLIRVEQIRELSEQLALTAHGGAATVAVLQPADAMNAFAANALLKTLEEPRPGTTLILVTAVPSRLPATLISRCQRLRVRTPERAEALAWLTSQRGPHDWDAVLDVIGNAPLTAAALDPEQVTRLRQETLAALRAAQAGGLDIAGTAERWARGEHFELRLACIENWLTGRIETCAAGAGGGDGRGGEMRSSTHLSYVADAANMAPLLRLLDAVYQLRRLALTAINRSLALEQLLWQCARGSAA
jgi:DNA polymerase-3 subunit delta'